MAPRAKRPVEPWEVRNHLLSALRGPQDVDETEDFTGLADQILADVRVWCEGDTVFVDCREGEYTQPALFQFTVTRMPAT